MKKMKSVNILIMVAIPIILILFRQPISQWLTQKDVTITVTKTERVQSRDGNGAQYLVWAKKSDGNPETFKCIDDWAFLKWNSSDVYGQLQVGKTFVVHVSGWRIGFLSAYRNIISIKSSAP